MKVSEAVIPPSSTLITLQNQLNGIQKQLNALCLRAAEQENLTAVKLQELGKRVGEIQVALSPNAGSADFSQVTEDSAREWASATA